jgi:RNA polymerase sigma-70 factor (ECF subfamily)
VLAPASIPEPASEERMTSPESEQSELAEGLRRGDERAFEQLYREFADSVFHLAARVLGNDADASDVLQETFVAVFRRIETWRGEGSLKSWLFQICVRFALRMKRRRPFTLDFNDEEVTSPPPSYDPPPAETDFRSAVDEAIQKLPTKSRAVFVMFTVEGLSHPEIAQVLGVDEGTSKSQLHYARSLLKRRLARFERELA